MASPLMLGLGLAFICSSIFYLAVSKSRRDILLSRVPFQRRRTSGATTPPRDLAAAKKAAFDDKAPYKDTYPPSRRSTLAVVANVMSPSQKKKLGSLKPNPKAYDLQIPFEASYQVQPMPAYLPAEFSVEEARALGNFPDYPTLSGVPLPNPYKEFDIKKALPRPYRPFRWVYHQTMSYKKMEPDWWLEIENTYVERVNQRKDLFAKYGKMVLDYMPGTELGCKEIMEIALQFYCARYPQHFSLSKDKTVFYNGLLKNETNLKLTHPLHVLLQNVPEDFAMVYRNPEDGYYYFRSGVICSSLGWNVATKLGMRMDEIHVPIPDYKEKMQFSMDRYFAKMPTDSPIQRGSWGLEIDQPLFMPPGDPHEEHRMKQMPDLPLSRCHLRVDWQTLRRLPLSSSVVFNFKALFTPVEEFRDEPYVPSVLLKVLKEGKKSLMEYKNTWHVEHVVIPAMEQYEREQKEKGLMDKDWEVRTLDEYPYFPGWEEKWHRQQGY
ncbi:MAG: hypothetical protein M1819_003982 [Sarea resinae]|nr:MAG: hypothetical protein M1819_003982 [Sarea resinae]